MSAATDPVSSASAPVRPARTGDESVMDAILSSLFQPGLNTVTQRIMNFSFYGLVLSLLLLLFLSSGSPHVVALLFLSIGLYAGVNWFLHELEKLPPSALEIQEMPKDAKDRAQPPSTEVKKDL